MSTVSRPSSLLPSTLLDLSVEQMAQGGDGIGRSQGYVIFARGGLPGERVRVVLETCKPTYARGRVVEVLTPAEERVAPRLPGADHIPWQHIAYDAQLRFKRDIVQEQLARLGGISQEQVMVAPVLPAAHPWGYRNIAHLHARRAEDETSFAIGYYAASSHRVQDMPEDPLLLPVLNEALAGLREVLREPPHPPHNRPLDLEAVTLRGSAAHRTAIAVLHGARTGRLERLAERWVTTVDALTGCALASPPARRSPQAGSRQEPGPEPEPPAVMLREDLGGMTFLLSPETFFQTHTAQAEVLLDVVRDGLDLQAHERLLDAYSGAGTFALPLSREVGAVVAIEEHASAVADGRRSAHHNGVGNVSFVAGSVERVLPDLEGGPFAAAVLDPPRRGCHPLVLQTLAAAETPRLAYVSCHPGILARDVRVLLDGGYRLVSVQPVDLFPQTPHIESVALLKKEEK